MCEQQEVFLKTIDLDQWPRRPQYELYRRLDYPYFSLTAPVVVEGLAEKARSVNSSFTIALVYLLSKAANELPAFRTRIRGESVVLHDLVHPSITVLAESDQLGFCTIPFTDDFDEFRFQAEVRISQAREYPSLQDPPGVDNMLFMTSIPWVAFSSITHPVPLKQADSVPRIAWGKMHERQGKASLPLSVQCNHAVMDGVHLGRFYERVQSLLTAPFTAIEG